MWLLDEVHPYMRLPLKVVVSWSPQDRRCRSLRPCVVRSVETTPGRRKGECLSLNLQASDTLARRP
jgi:hypothetical protein